MQFARLNDVTLHYQMIGAPSAAPLIVFVNSLGTDFRIWRDVIVRLAGDFSILLYDLRGHGLSDVGETPYRMDDHVDDLAALLDHVEATNVVVCGISVGGQIAQGLYQSRPDLVRALILCDTAAKIGDADFWAARIAAIEKNGIAGIADALLERWFAPAFRQHDSTALDGYRNMLVRQPVAGYIATCEALRDADFTAAARQIAVPTICIVGEADGSTPPPVVAAFAKLIPGARYEVIKGAGHLPCVEQPASLVAIIRAFIALIATEVTPHVTH